MKRIFFLTGAILLLTVPLSAENSLHFSTKLGAEYAWELSRVNNAWTLSFVDDAIVVDNASPSDSQLLGDYVLLPTMTLTGLTDRGGLVTAVLEPREAFAIESDTSGATVLTADMASGGLLAVGTNKVAYSEPEDDLNIRSFDENYGTIIPGLANDERRGLQIDLSFSGDAAQGGNLYRMLLGNSGVARGTLSGQITAIPEPATLLLLGLGAAAAAGFRPRRSK